MFECGIYIQKAWHFPLGDVFMYKNQDTFQKARQFALRFYKQKLGNFALRNFSLNFWNLQKGADFFFWKNALCGTFLCIQNNALSVTFLYTKSLTLCVTYFWAKNIALFVMFLYLKCIIYYYYLTINARTIREIRSKNKIELFIENWSYSYNK